MDNSSAPGITASISELFALKRFALDLNNSRKARCLQNGNHRTSIRGRGMDFAEVRNYQAGDEIRHMEWRVTARTGRPHVKLYQEEREKPVVLLVDFSPSMLFGTRIALKSVVAARLAALLSWTVIGAGDRIGGLLFSANEHFEFTPKARESSVLPMLGALSHLTMQSPDNLPASPGLSGMLSKLLRVVKPGSTVILISDFYSLDTSCAPSLRRLRNENDMLLYHICDPLELAPPKPGHYPISDGNCDLLLDTTRHTVRAGYARYCKQRQQAIQTQCHTINALYTQVTAADDLTHILQRSLMRRLHGQG